MSSVRGARPLSYHDLWWIPNDPYGSFMAGGIHGQRLFGPPGLDLVVVHFGCQAMSLSVPRAPLGQARSSRSVPVSGAGAETSVGAGACGAGRGGRPGAVWQS